MQLLPRLEDEQKFCTICVDYFLPVPLTKKFTENLITYEEEKKMPYVTSAERIGIEKGMLSDAREMVLEALDIRFSSNVPGDIQKK